METRRHEERAQELEIMSQMVGSVIQAIGALGKTIRSGDEAIIKTIANSPGV